MLKVTIVDYDAGNILSVKRAFEYWGGDVEITSRPQDVLNAAALVLPGVGAFADGMSALNRYNLADAIREYSRKERPFLGICLGMQMMLDESSEFGINEGLGLIPGKVSAVEETTVEGLKQKIPHIGWSELMIPAGKDNAIWDTTILTDICQKEAVYFVHSYTAFPESDEHRLADSYYGGRQIAAVIKKDYLYGCQFHPEKSGQVGLKILKSFLTIK